MLPLPALQGNSGMRSVAVRRILLLLRPGIQRQPVATFAFRGAG
ncbi:hypothetical protein ACE8EZ_05520 [Pantoea deleyi]